jgi:hypothetical protein
LTSFAFTGQEETCEIIISFEELYQDNAYVFVAMTDHPACIVTLKSKEAECAVVIISRIRFSMEPVGLINWIAIGAKQ